MIIIFKDENIIGIDKNLLQILNTTLEDLSNTLSTIKLSIASLNNEKIEVENNFFKVNEIELLTIENIKIYELEKTESNELPPLEESKPEITELPPLGEDLLKTESNELSPLEETKPEITELPPLGEDLLKTESNELPPLEETKPEITELPPLGKDLLKTESNELPPLEEATQLPPTGGIQLTFEDELNEIIELLNMNQKEITELFMKDLEKASKDLGIDLETLKELSKELIKQIEDNYNKFQKALNNKDYDQLHKISHSLKGASLNLRLSNLALILKTIDEKSKANEDIALLKDLVDKFYKLINNLKPAIFGESEIKPQKPNIEISPEIRNLINKTIQKYLETQNEKQLKKDLKYIKAILGIEINSFEELKNIIKG